MKLALYYTQKMTQSGTKFQKTMLFNENLAITLMYMYSKMHKKKETGIDEIFKIYKIVIGGASKPMTG